MIPIFNNNINDQVPITLYYIHGSTTNYHYFHADNHRAKFIFFPSKIHSRVDTRRNKIKWNPEKSIRWLNCIEMYRIQRKETKKNQIIRRRPSHLLPNFYIFKHEIKKRSRTQFCDANEKRVFRKIRGINDPFARHCRSIKKGIIDPIGKLRKSRNFTALGQSARAWRTRVNIWEKIEKG